VEDRERLHHYVDLARIWMIGLMEMGNERRAVAAKLGEEVYILATRIGDWLGAGAVAFHVGHCYFDMDGEGNLNTAQGWYQKSLGQTDPRDDIRRGLLLFELAQVRYKQVQYAVAAKATPLTLEKLFNDALQSAVSAAAVILPEHLEGRMRLHHVMGNILDDAGGLVDNAEYLKAAQKNYQEYIRLAEQLNSEFEAVKGCREMARLKWKLSLFDDALVYAEESERKCRQLGPGAAQALDLSRRLVADIMKTMQAQQGGTP
jgi:hypothetical protein